MSYKNKGPDPCCTVSLVSGCALGVAALMRGLSGESEWAGDHWMPQAGRWGMDRSLPSTMWPLLSQSSPLGPSRRGQLPIELFVKPLHLGHPLGLFRPYKRCGFNAGIPWLRMSQLFPHLLTATPIFSSFSSPHIQLWGCLPHHNEAGRSDVAIIFKGFCYCFLVFKIRKPLRRRLATL